MAVITMKEIASMLGISAATVSMALNDRPGVNAQTKEKVLALVEKLNYTGTTAKKVPHSNGVISFLVYKRYGKILSDTQFFADLIEAVERAARLVKYTVALTYCKGKEDLIDSLQAVLATQPAGVLLLGTEMKEKDLNPFERLDLPVVVMDCDLCGCGLDTVTIHNEDGIWRAVKYLYSQGYRDIGYLRSSFLIRNFEQRILGYQYCLKNFGLSYNEEKIFMLEPTVEGAQKDINELLKQGIKFPEALIADNDLIALGAMKGFLQNGIRIPEDISLIGFDDIPMASFFEPPLTSVLVSRDALGLAAVEQLLWRMQHLESPPQRLSVGTELMLRKSVKLNT